MKNILALLALVGTALISSSGFSSAIPTVTFICKDSDPLVEIMKITHDEGKESGGLIVEEYVEAYKCWYVNPTPVEVVSVVGESFDQSGRLWSIVEVKPHQSAGFNRRLTRYAVMDATIARAYIQRHKGL